MTGTSTIFSDYLGGGLAVNRPATLVLSPGALGIYFATDTGALSLWNGSAWVAYSSESVLVANGGTTLGAATTIKADGTTVTAALSGGVATLAAVGGGGGGGLTVSDGTQTIPDVTSLLVNNLNLSAEATSPSLVREINSNTSSAAQFSSAPAVGNYLVFIGIDNGTPAELPTGFSVLAHYYGALGITVAGGFVTGSTGNPTFSTYGGGYHWCLQEYTNVGSGTIAGYAGAPTTSGSTISYNFPSVAEGSLIVWGSVDNTSAPTSITPSGSSLVVNCSPFYYLNVFHSPCTASGSETVSYTGSGATAMGGIVLPGIPSIGNVGITPAIPVTINGTPEGSFQSIVITTGNSTTTASLSGGVLTLALGTP